MRSPRSSAAPASVLLVVALLSACSGGDGKTAASATPSPTPSATASPTPSPTPAVVPADLLTGAKPRSTAPLVAVKIDNAPLARQYQRGLGRAAIVYQELVEGGSTRFLAVFESDRAGTAEVGPIRSVRESDVELLRGYGKISVAYSGAQPAVLAIVRAAQRSGWLADAGYDAIPSAYRLAERRKDARNFYAVPSTLARLRPGNGPVDIGLRFGRAVAGLPTARAVANFSGMTHVGLAYNATTGTYAVSQNGRLMPGVAPVNVVIQRVVVRGSRFRDVHGFPTPYTVTTGSGNAVVLRGGARVVGRWQRTGHGATHFVDAKGRDIPLAVGPTWVLLVPVAGSASYS